MSLFDVIGNVFGNMAGNAGGMAIDGAFQFCKGVFGAIRKNLIKNNHEIVEDITPERAEEIRDELALNIIERVILTKILQVKIDIDCQSLVLLAQNLANLITNYITNDVRFLGNLEYRRCIVDIVSEKLMSFIKINEAQYWGIIGPSLSLTDPADVAKTIKQITKNIRSYVTSDIKKLLDISDDCSEMRILLAAEKDSRKTREIVNKLTNLKLGKHWFYKPLHWAVYHHGQAHNKEAVITRLLASEENNGAGASIDNRSYYFTALHQAIRRKDEKSILLLLEHGADLEKRDKQPGKKWKAVKWLFDSFRNDRQGCKALIDSINALNNEKHNRVINRFMTRNNIDFNDENFGEKDRMNETSIRFKK